MSDKGEEGSGGLLPVIYINDWPLGVGLDVIAVKWSMDPSNPWCEFTLRKQLAHKFQQALCEISGGGYCEALFDVAIEDAPWRYRFERCRVNECLEVESGPGVSFFLHALALVREKVEWVAQENDAPGGAGEETR